MMLGEWVNGRWVERCPTHCINGHLLEAVRVLVDWRPSLCLGKDGALGHRLYDCRQCGMTVYVPQCPALDQTDVADQGLRPSSLRD